MSESFIDRHGLAKARAASMAQARALLPQAEQGGLSFSAYLPPSLATWLLERIAQGVFADPSEAVFAIFSHYEDFEPHDDLRDELLRRIIQASIDDPRPFLSSEEVWASLECRLAEPLPASAEWQKIDHDA